MTTTILTRRLSRPLYAALLICALYVLLALTYARAVPLLESSDEAAHFLYVHNLLTDRALPVIESRAQIADQSDVVKRWSLESHQPPLYYLIGAVLISPTQRGDIEQYLQPNPLIFLRGITLANPNKWLHPVQPSGDTATAIWLLRLYSLVLSTGTLWLIYQTARLAFGSSSLALTAMLLVAFTPTYLNIGSSVNNDNLVTFLYTAGVYLTLRLWRHGSTRRDVLLLSLVLAASPLTKITGVTLFGVVYPALLFGAWRGRLTWRQVVTVLALSGGLTLLLSGGWYLRNLTLYGDPLASSATLALWGREFAKPSESGDLWGEISRVWRSFRAMTGHLHQPVWGLAWDYAWFTWITIIGAGGVAWALVPGSRRGIAAGAAGADDADFGYRSPPRNRGESGGGVVYDADTIALLLLVTALPVLAVAVGTRTIDISYGRLLFPGLVGFAPLLVFGWRRVIGRLAPQLLMPLAVAALLYPVQTLAQAYPRLEAVEAVPAAAVPVNIRTGDLTLLAYQVQTQAVIPGGTVRLTVYLTGAHPDNPALFLTLLDPLTNESVGTSAVYPGGSATADLQPGVIYRAPLVIPLADLPDPLSPRLLRVQPGWQTPLSTAYLPLNDANGAPVPALVLDAAVLLDPRYPVPVPETPVSATFGEAITLKGLTLTPTDYAPGDTLDLSLTWQLRQALPEAHSLTVQLLDASGSLITQADGALPGYPATAWLPGTRTLDQRQLTLPADLPPGEYQLYVGWYRLSDFRRLSVQGSGAINDLFPLPVTLRVTD